MVMHPKRVTYAKISSWRVSEGPLRVNLRGDIDDGRP